MVVFLQVLMVVGLLFCAFKLADRERRRNPPGPLVDPEPVPKAISIPRGQVPVFLGESITEKFSESEFSRLFAKKNAEEGREAADGLGIWYALGHLCMLASIGSVKGLDVFEGEEILNLARQRMLDLWNMPSKTYEEFSEFNKEKLSSVLNTFQAIDNLPKMQRFFALYDSDILGGFISFYPEALSEPLNLLLMENPFIVEEDDALHGMVGRIFMEQYNGMQRVFSNVERV